jgi:CRP/FNR family transcriptional regulator, nitrogen oxide reductase regulator
MVPSRFLTKQGRRPILKMLSENLLKDLEPFEGLDASQLRSVLDKATPNRFEKGSHIFQTGEPAERFYVLLDGYVRVVRHTEQGQQIILLHIPSGQFLGIAAALGYTSYPATALAVSDCLTLCWPTPLWRSFVEEYQGFGAAAMRSVGVRIEEFNEKIVEMATRQVEQRVAAVLLRLIHQAGRETERGIEINFPITREDPAQMTGSTLHTISRLLSSWDKSGITQSGRKWILVCDRERLAALSSG